MRHPICRLALLLPLAATCVAAPREIPTRLVWEWTMPKATEANLATIADTAAGLGFNGLMMSPPRQHLALMRDLCHARGIRLYLSTIFAGGEPEWQQVLLPSEAERQKQPFGETYQQGGEPLSPDEVYSGPLPCWSRPEVREHFRRLVTEYAQLPVDGLAFDMVGYVNYRRCHCPVCEAGLAQYRRSHANLTGGAAEAQWAEQVLVDFTNEMAAAARQAKPQIALATHVYPYFQPHPLYGHRLNVDYVGQTVAWFFRPHWPLAKVARLAREVVAQDPRHAAPFIGFYATPARDVRSAKRVRAEIELIRSSGANAIQFAELGNIAAHAPVARAVAEALKGVQP